jgi:hypothetical protein
MEPVKITTLAIEGERLIIKDAMTMLYEEAEAPEWPYVAVEHGEYIVSVLLEDGKNRGVTVCLAGSVGAKRGKEIGRVSVDHGAVAVCEYDALLAAAKADPDGYSDWTEDECEGAVWENESGVLRFGDVRIAYLKTGVGDGAFPVWELLEGHRVVGMECLFLSEPKARAEDHSMQEDQ